MTVSHILSAKGRAVVTARSKDFVESVVKLLAEKKIGAVVVTNDKGGIVGIVSERDVVRKLAQEGGAVLKLPVEQVMTSNVFTCTESDSEEHLMTLMTDHRIRHLPVVAGGKLVGMISIGDVVKHRIDAIEREAENMKAYISGVG